MKKMRDNKILKWLNKITTYLLLTVMLSGAFLIIYSKISGEEPNLFGYQIKVVLSGSMEPDIQTGSIIALKSGGDMSRFVKGDVITFRDEYENVVTHRISKRIQQDGQLSYQTKGDNNNRADPHEVLPKNIKAEYVGITIPYIGYFIGFLQSKNGALVIMGLGGLLLFHSFFSLFRTISNLEALHKKKEEEA